MVALAHAHDRNEAGITQHIHMGIRQLQGTAIGIAVHGLELLLGHLLHAHPARMKGEAPGLGPLAGAKHRGDLHDDIEILDLNGGMWADWGAGGNELRLRALWLQGMHRFRKSASWHVHTPTVVPANARADGRWSHKEETMHVSASRFGRRRVLVAAMALLAVLGSAFASTSARAQDWKIGALFPLSGGLSVLGTEALAGDEIAVDMVNEKGGVNGQKVVLVKADATSPANATNEARRLVTREGVKFLTGTYGSSISLAIAAVGNQFKVPYW